MPECGVGGKPRGASHAPTYLEGSRGTLSAHLPHHRAPAPDLLVRLPAGPRDPASAAPPEGPRRTQTSTCRLDTTQGPPSFTTEGGCPTTGTGEGGDTTQGSPYPSCVRAQTRASLGLHTVTAHLGQSKKKKKKNLILRGVPCLPQALLLWKMLLSRGK